MNSQRGAFAIGLIVGLLVGLALALAVALYVTKVPVPFLNKVPQRTAEQDAAEAERNKNWDPNAPLAGKVPVVKNPVASAPAGIPPGIAVAPQVTTAARPSGPAPAASGPAAKRDPASILAGQAPAPTTATPAVPGKSTKAGTDPFTYFVQVGAFSRAEEAEQQRARVGMMGMPAKVSEREQSGRTVYRVRLGPYERKDDADAVQERLANNGVEAALVRVER